MPTKADKVTRKHIRTGLHKITFPKQGLGPMLFLEWLEKNQTKEFPIKFTIETKPQIDEVLEDLFVVKLYDVIGSVVDDCFQYLKNNIGY